MDAQHPRLWPYSANNSPLPLPETSVLLTPQRLLSLVPPDEGVATVNDVLGGQTLLDHVSKYTHGEAALASLLDQEGVAGLEERRPLLVLGELANPHRLAMMNMGVLPLLAVRLEGVCRTWSDGLDARDAYPGVHHVTLARTPGWWEVSFLAWATKEQLKSIREWLENGVRSSWRPVKLAEGGLRLEADATLPPPSEADVAWDGTQERVDREAPPPTGPSLNLGEVMAVVHTRVGCYNHRGRLARCVHINQRPFHDNLFRKGSSFRWDDVLSTR